MEPEGSLPHSQVPATPPYPDYLLAHFCKYKFISCTRTKSINRHFAIPEQNKFH